MGLKGTHPFYTATVKGNSNQMIMTDLRSGYRRVNSRVIQKPYNNLLGYVYLSNGKMLNEEIVKAGYANVMTIPPNVKYKDRFLNAYQEARKRKRGLWEE